MTRTAIEIRTGFRTFLIPGFRRFPTGGGGPRAFSGILPVVRFDVFSVGGKRKTRLPPGFLAASLWSPSSRVSNRVMMSQVPCWDSGLILWSDQAWSDQVLHELDQVG